MRPFIAALTAALGSCIGTCAVGIVWSLVSVYLLGQVDPKFGPGGTVQLAIVIAFAGGVAGAMGGLPAYWLLFRRRASVKVSLPLLAGAVIGGCLAPLLGWVLRVNPSPLPEIPGLIGMQMMAGFVVTGLLGSVVMRTAYRQSIHH